MKQLGMDVWPGSTFLLQFPNDRDMTGKVILPWAVWVDVTVGGWEGEGRS